ncbi:L-rhamnose mutarotase [Streptomyces canus]|uniref:L-rhamnose mutarotase n=1 Tax=Streptomyces canus TaxID=58343 RepID=UPI00386ED3F7|nr:L-rhamnose mutarotase [Streptomyces canus]
MKVALHTEVRADRSEEYDAAHREVSPRASEAECEGGTDLFPVLEVEDYQAMIAELDRLPVNIAWQARMADLLDVVHDGSAQSADASLPVVGEL